MEGGWKWRKEAKELSLGRISTSSNFGIASIQGNHTWRKRSIANKELFGQWRRSSRRHVVGMRDTANLSGQCWWTKDKG